MPPLTTIISAILIIGMRPNIEVDANEGEEEILDFFKRQMSVINLLDERYNSVLSDVDEILKIQEDVPERVENFFSRYVDTVRFPTELVEFKYLNAYLFNEEIGSSTEHLSKRVKRDDPEKSSKPRVLSRKEAFARAYVTYVAFFTTIVFRVSCLYYSSVHSDKNTYIEKQVASCNELFLYMHKFTFFAYDKIIDDLRDTKIVESRTPMPESIGQVTKPLVGREVEGPTLSSTKNTEYTLPSSDNADGSSTPATTDDALESTKEDEMPWPTRRTLELPAGSDGKYPEECNVENAATIMSRMDLDFIMNENYLKRTAERTYVSDVIQWKTIPEHEVFRTHFPIDEVKNVNVEKRDTYNMILDTVKKSFEEKAISKLVHFFNSVVAGCLYSVDPFPNYELTEKILQNLWRFKDIKQLDPSEPRKLYKKKGSKMFRSNAIEIIRSVLHITTLNKLKQWRIVQNNLGYEGSSVGVGASDVLEQPAFHLKPNYLTGVDYYLTMNDNEPRAEEPEVRWFITLDDDDEPVFIGSAEFYL